ncbi:MAG: hypothetical protein IPN85_13355 [Flavobacteriales bacterium]|nr:hypothetical protein [Flavobacteriales bacterium]
MLWGFFKKLIADCVWPMEQVYGALRLEGLSLLLATYFSAIQTLIATSAGYSDASPSGRRT